jgi:hypothetical protein
MNPANGALRFLLEVTALGAFAGFGWNLTDTGWRIFLAVALPLLFALLWGIFAVRNDPSRSGKTVIQTPGWIRLLLELSLLGAASWMLYRLGYPWLFRVYTALLITHYLLSRDRIRWLIKQ